MGSVILMETFVSNDGRPQSRIEKKTSNSCIY